MKIIRLCILLSIILVFPFERAAAEHPWVQVQSPHFTIICNGSEKDGREAAVDLERMRVVLIKALPSIRQDPNVPVIVFVTADENMFAALVPTYWQRPQGSRSNSWIQAGRDRNYIVMRVAFRVSSEFQLKFDYASLMATINFPRSPLWFRAGFAEFFAVSEIDNDKAKVGMPSTRYAQRIQHAPLIPLPRFFAVRNNSPEYSDPEVRWNFDAESWGLFHYLLLGDKGAHRAQLENYLELLSHGKKQLDAAQEAFGDFGKLQDKLGPYYAQKGFPFAEMDLPRQGYTEQLTVRSLPQSESNAWLAEYHLRSKRQPEAKSLIDAALAANPNEPRAHEAQGLYNLQTPDYENALKEFSAAAAGDASLYLSHYYKGILSSYWKSSHDIPESSEQDLRHAVELMPRYAPASLAVARLVARKDGNLTDAIAFARKASESEPGSPRYALAYANILLLAGDGNQAETQARQVLESELSPLEKESATGILKLAQDCKPGSPCKGLGHLEFGATKESPVTVEAEASVPGTAAADASTPVYRLQGVMRKIVCTEEGKTATLASGENDITYGMAKATRVTWPETFWLDSAYLHSCKHFDGEPAAIDYKTPAADSKPEATAVRIQDRF
jgi:hypothetical protein